MEVSELGLAAGRPDLTPQGLGPLAALPRCLPWHLLQELTGPASCGRARTQNCTSADQRLRTGRRQCWVNPGFVGEVRAESGRSKGRAAICRLPELQLRQGFSSHGGVSCT